MSATYNPVRRAEHITKNPLEIDLVYNVRPCGTCKFFWPDNPSEQPYGPFPAFDFKENFPAGNKPQKPNENSFPWVAGVTREQAFPNGEIMDGCRKAPIMTIGINPNLTAFAPGQMGTSWVYPNFSSDDGTDGYAKYAYYYRYRSVYQEHFNLPDIEQFLLPDGQIKAEKDGVVVSAERKSESPNFDIQVKYEGDHEATTISLKRNLGDPRYVLLYDHFPPNNAFKKGDIIAAKLDVTAGKDMEVYQGLIGYYEQFVPVLGYFEKFLTSKGADNPQLRVGEDVGQLDMVACASPHWNEQFMGNQLEKVVNNCVSQNAWAMKQMVQTKPAILFLVGESSYDMFNGAFGKLLKRSTPLSKRPVDGAFTLFRETIDSNNPTHFEFQTKINGQAFNISTRIIVAPHFSYDTNYVAQFRLSKADWDKLYQDYNSCYEYFKNDEGYIKVEYPKEEGDFYAVQLLKDVSGIFKELESKHESALQFLTPFYYDPHKQMSEVLEHLYQEGKLIYTNNSEGNGGTLNRTEGGCQFCVNSHWQFPQGCPYGKEHGEQPPVGFLQEVAKQIVQAGK